ncbi:MAG: hypothetical protein ABIR91_01980 [Candidatus Saccharimonadales bacterium]
MNRALIGIGLIAACIAVVALCVPVAAEGYGGGSVAGYAATRPIDNGTIVQLTVDGTNQVSLATPAKLESMFGVTVSKKELPVALSNQKLKNEVFVAVSGTYTVLVSTQGGSIAVGDYITQSSISGIGMKASVEQKTVLGRALGAFDGKGTVLGTTTLKDTSGNANQTVKLGSVPVTIGITRNPNEKSTKVKVPEVLERIGQAIAEKPVSAVRIYLSMAIAAISIIAAIIILYSGVRNSMISIGRNPMSKKSIFRALLEIVLTSILILVIGLFAVYLLLKL